MGLFPARSWKVRMRRAKISYYFTWWPESVSTTIERESRAKAFSAEGRVAAQHRTSGWKYLKILWRNDVCNHGWFARLRSGRPSVPRGASSKRQDRAHVATAAFLAFNCGKRTPKAEATMRAGCNLDGGSHNPTRRSRPWLDMTLRSCRWIGGSPSPASNETVRTTSFQTPCITGSLEPCEEGHRKHSRPRALRARKKPKVGRVPKPNLTLRHCIHVGAIDRWSISHSSTTSRHERT